MLNSNVSNSHFGKRSAARVMTIFRSLVGAHIPNIEYFEVYGGIWTYMNVNVGICGYMGVNVGS